MTEKKKEGLYVTTKITTIADQNLSKFQAWYLFNKGQKLKKMDALNKMLEDFKIPISSSEL
jgi:hypothetical protein